MSYLKVIYLENEENNNEQNNHWLPLAKSDLLWGPLEECKSLTQGNDVKRIYKLTLNTRNLPCDFLPGDTIGILPTNNKEEINEILLRLNVIDAADKLCTIKVVENCSKKNATVPKHLPTAPTTLRNIFLNNVEVRSVPKKLFLKSLLNFFTDSSEKSELQEILAPTGSAKYLDLISNEGRSLLGLLNKFPSCCPPIELILEHLPPLQPRPYSIASSPLRKHQLDIIFDVIELPDGRKGTCTGWLIEQIQVFNEKPVKIPFYFRKSNNFIMPSNLQLPIILIATGTGLAPFLSFLEHRALLKNTDEQIGDCILIYGCRYSNRDYICSTNLNNYRQMNVLNKLITAFSREHDKCFVTHKLKLFGNEFVQYVMDKEALVYFCGNLENVEGDIKRAIVENFIQFGRMDESLAVEAVKQMEKSGKYVIDLWN